MEFVKKSIHSEKDKVKQVTRIPIEEDINISDVKPDAGAIIFQQGNVKIAETKVAMNRVSVKGTVEYQILYTTEQKDGKEEAVASMQGSLPFYEDIVIEGIDGQDKVICKLMLENMRIQLINSRKISIRTSMICTTIVKESMEEEICTGLGEYAEYQLECRKKNIEYLELVSNKKDVFRIREEYKLLSGMPNIDTILWKSCALQQVRFRAGEGKLGVSGELQVFLLYQPEGEGQVTSYETTIPFHGTVDCAECWEKMLVDVDYEVSKEEIYVKEDMDGEDRVISVELSLNLDMSLWNPDRTQMIADVYGITCETQVKRKESNLKRLLQEITLQEKLAGELRIADRDMKQMQMIHAEGKLESVEVEMKGDTVLMQGKLLIRVLYQVQEQVYGLLQEEVPVRLSRKINMQSTDMEISCHAQLEQFQVVQKDSALLEWRALTDIHMLLYENQAIPVMTELVIQKLDTQQQEKLPGFAIYYVKEGDSLWEIGKKYYVSVDNLLKVNHLQTEDIKVGEKLLIVKSGELI